MTTIAGRYQLIEPSRPGAPQRARDLQTAQTVLLREAPLPETGADAIVARARASAGICHPSLITLFDASVDDAARLLLAYEYVPAQTLAHVSGGQPFNLRRAAEIVAEVADAAAELHARDLWHGAISPQTVLVTMKGKAKLDRVGDPMLPGAFTATAAADLAALGTLLDQLARTHGSGIPRAPAVEVIVRRAREGAFESAAVMAAWLRRL